MMLDPEEWARVKAIFDEALARPPCDRVEYVTSACGGDSELHRRVEALLRSHERAGGFLEHPTQAARRPEMSVDLTGQTVRGYRVLSRVGAGGMGEVYLAHDDKLDRPVALKLLSSELRADPAHWQRFHQEARAASSLNHPHILVVHDVDELDGRPLMVTEYVEGQTLRAHLTEGCLTVAETLDIASQIASALAAAHARGLVHRDVKPENVMVRPDGYVKVLDFGLAKPITADTQAALLTSPGLLMGTPRYMSPEQARGLPVDARSDVWSLGVVVYEMLAGRRPFDGPTTADVLAALLEREPPPLRHVAAPVAECVMRALAKAPAQRFMTAREFHAALAALKTAGGEGASRDRPVKRARKTIDSVAVLPLSTPAADTEIEYLADGITESVISALSQLPKLRVMARSTVFRYKGRDVDPQTLGRELGVRAVLVGRLYRNPDGFRISAELVDAADGSQLWGGQLQRHAADALSLQEDAAAEIAEQLRPRLTSAERKRIVKRQTASPRAFEAYLKGRYQLAKRTMDGFTKAIALFEQAIAEDRHYALAYAGLADCWTLLSAAAYGEPSMKTMARARDAAEQALRLDPSETEVQTAIGFVRFRIDWNWRAAEDALRRACELSPGHAFAHHRFALLLSALGRHDEALAEIQRARELDPLSLIIGTAVGRVMHFQRRYDDAIEQVRRTLELDPQFIQARFDLGMAYAQAARYDEAIAEFEAGLTPNDSRSLMRSVLGHIYAVAGRTAEAEAVLRDLERRYRRGEASSYDVSLPLIGLGRTTDGLDWLERACDAHSGLLVYLKVEPMFDSVRGESRFQAIMRRLAFP